MDYFFYNTDATGMTDKPKPRFKILIDREFAAVGGGPKYGEKLKKIKVADILLMYENMVGVVAIGKVLELWNGKQYSDPLYYTPSELPILNGGPFEYRIQVKWFLDCSDDPVKIEYMRQLFGSQYNPRGAITKIVTHRLVIEKMISGLLDTHLKFPDAIDKVPPSPERVETKTYRILRDTAMARYVKRLHEYKCQICGHTIELSNGERYAEAHHIMPLGEPHNGPDIIENILCVCPNHHAELDYKVSYIPSTSSINGHPVDSQYIEYHNKLVNNSKYD